MGQRAVDFFSANQKQNQKLHLTGGGCGPLRERSASSRPPPIPCQCCTALSSGAHGGGSGNCSNTLLTQLKASLQANGHDKYTSLRVLELPSGCSSSLDLLDLSRTHRTWSPVSGANRLIFERHDICHLAGAGEPCAVGFVGADGGAAGRRHRRALPVPALHGRWPSLTVRRALHMHHLAWQLKLLSLMIRALLLPV